MRRYYYAQINESNVCIGWLDTYREIVAPNMIPIDAPDDQYLGRVWNPATESWS